jgi:hypothetical protein
VIFFNISYLAETFLLRFFPPPSVREMIVFFDKTIAKRTPLGQRQSVQNEGLRIPFPQILLFIHCPYRLFRSCIYAQRWSLWLCHL